MKIVDKTNALAILSILSVSAAYGESLLTLDSNLSYINQQNLQSNQVANASGTVTTDRTGWQLGGRWGWQQLNNQGGYSIAAQANLDQGLDNAGNIRSLGFNGAWMSALSQNWLTRLNLQFSDYQDDDQPAYNNQAGGVGLTLGWFGQQNSGLDLNVAWQQEQYDDNPAAAYTADRFSLGGRYYFSHPHNAPYWNIDAEMSRFDAMPMQRYSYNVSRLSLAYSAWHWKKLEGNIQFTWRNYRYDDMETSDAMHGDENGMDMMGMRMNNVSDSMANDSPNGSQGEAQNDTYITTTLSLSYPLSKKWHINSRINAGQYRSNLVKDQFLLSGYFGVSVRY